MKQLHIHIECVLPVAMHGWKVVYIYRLVNTIKMGFGYNNVLVCSFIKNIYGYDNINEECAIDVIILR